MKNALVILALLFVGCQNSLTVKPQETEPVVPPEGVSFISAEYDGKTYDYIQGQRGVISRGTSFGTFSENTQVVGLGEDLTDPQTKTSWNVQFFFTHDQWKKNVANATELFKTGDYSYLLRDTNNELASSQGAVISTSTVRDDNSGIGNTTLIQQDRKSRSFQVTKVYFSPSTDTKLIWIEGSFEGWMQSGQQVKGRFRIKTQPNL